MVDIISETALKISWSRPSRNYGTVTHYYVNISALAGFDSLTDTRQSIDRNSKDVDSNQSFAMQVKVNKYLRIQINLRITATPKVKFRPNRIYGFLFLEPSNYKALLLLICICIIVRSVFYLLLIDHFLHLNVTNAGIFTD